MSFTRKQKTIRKGPPRISDAEWLVMKVVWKLKEATSKQVVDALASETDWKPKTIHTLISRLVQKGALASERPGREYLFRPVVTEEESRLAASSSFLDKVFDGEVAPFLTCFLRCEKLSRKQIQELRRILQEGK